MREIKFRAWDGKRVRYDVTGFEHGFENEMAGVFLDGEFYHIESANNYGSTKLTTPPAVVMQFTGLKDRNGVDIYEGDIVCDDLLGICQVKYNEIHAAFKVLHKNNRTAKWFVDYLPNEFKYLRVIGNIHENPELLKG